MSNHPRCLRHSPLLPTTGCCGRLRHVTPGRDICRHVRQVAMCRSTDTDVAVFAPRHPAACHEMSRQVAAVRSGPGHMSTHAAGCDVPRRGYTRLVLVVAAAGPQ